MLPIHLYVLQLQSRPSAEVLTLDYASGILISGFVPPDGFNCRHVGHLLITLAWILSAQADHLIQYCCSVSSGRLNTLFWITGAKDLLATAATMGGIVVTQIGVFNRCACYTNWGRTGLALPERPDVAATLFKRLNTIYPAFTFSCIGVELVLIPLLICYQNRDALRVFTQRDDRKSNAPWFWKATKPLRSRTWRLEQGLTNGSRDGSIDMPPLTLTTSEEPEESEIERRQQDSTVPISTNTQSESTGVDPPSRSGTFPLGSNPDAVVQNRNTPQVRNIHRQD